MCFWYLCEDGQCILRFSTGSSARQESDPVWITAGFPNSNYTIVAFRQNTYPHSPELVPFVSSIWSSQNEGQGCATLKAGDPLADGLPAVICRSTRRRLWLGLSHSETKFDCNSLQQWPSLHAREKLHIAPHCPAVRILQGLHRTGAAARLVYILFLLPLFCRTQCNTQMVRRTFSKQNYLRMEHFTLLHYLLYRSFLQGW